MSGPSFPGAGAADDWDQDAEMAAYLADIEAGRVPEPGPREFPGCTVSLGEACDVDLADLEDPGFAEGRARDAMAPGPVLAALTEQAAENLSALSDDALLGTVSAARRLAARAEYLEHKAVAEFGRRRSVACEAAKAAGIRPGRREGEFPGEELAFHQVCSDNAAYEQLAFAADLAARLPDTFAGLGAGRLDRYRALIIHRATLSLSDDDAAKADQILAAAAPGLTYEKLRAKAAAVEMRLDPAAVRRRKDEARARHRRIEARREDSGNMAYGGRELSAEEALAAKAAIDADAIALRNGGAEGSLRDLRVRAYLARLQGRDPLGGLTGPAGRGSGRAGDEHRPGASGADEDEHRPGADEDADADEGRPGGFGGGPQGPGTPAGGLAPLPALITLVVSDGTLLGWSNAPGDAGTWGLLDPEDTRRLVQAASRHPRSRWCVTVTGPDGTAVAHGCARGQHPWTPRPWVPEPGPGPGQRDGPGQDRDGPPRQTGPPGPDAYQAAQLAGLLRRLNATLAPIAKGTCDHRHREDQYTPSRRLKHLVRARSATCTAPGCGARAINCDLDHTRAWPAGITCECQLGPLCRHHHRCKQAEGWRLEQPEPGVLKWRVPSGRTYTTTPTGYSI